MTGRLYTTLRTAISTILSDVGCHRSFLADAQRLQCAVIPYSTCRVPAAGSGTVSNPDTDGGPGKPISETDEGMQLAQSLAICEYLDEQHPEPALLPVDAEGRARVRALAQLVASEIHPLNNLRVLKYLVHELKVDDEAKLAWYRHWVTTGFDALEAMLAAEAGTGDFCHGDAPTLADICLVPQVYNAERFAWTSRPTRRSSASPPTVGRCLPFSRQPRRRSRMPVKQ